MCLIGACLLTVPLRFSTKLPALVWMSVGSLDKDLDKDLMLGLV